MKKLSVQYVVDAAWIIVDKNHNHD